MKKAKLLTLLLAAPILASCGVSRPSKPGFAKTSDADKISAAKFEEGVNKETQKLDFINANPKLMPSSQTKLEDKYFTKTTYERSKKAYRTSEDTENVNIEAKLDKNNKLFQFNRTEALKESVKTADKNYSHSDSNKNNSIYQVAKVDGKNYVVKVDKEKKEFAKEAVIEGSEKPEKHIDATAKSKISESIADIHGITVAELINGYEAAPSKEKNKFEFYKKDKVFTVVYNTERTDNIKVLDKVVAKSTIKEEYKVQIDFTEGKVKMLSWSSFESTDNFTANYEDYDDVANEDVVLAKGDVKTTKWQASVTISYERKDIKLQAEDISKYTKIGTSW